MHTEIQTLIASFSPSDREERMSAIREVVQNIILLGLSKTDFFTKASFYGGTSLRIFHGLERFSEDLDFTLKKKIPDFSLPSYFPAIIAEAERYGFHLDVELKEKMGLSNIDTAMARLSAYETFLTFSLPVNDVQKNMVIRVKFEVDVTAILGFEEETKLTPFLEPRPISVLDLPSLFAGKLAAVICREYKNRVKGRDYYDFLFFMDKGVRPNMEYLRNKLLHNGRIAPEDPWNYEVLHSLLVERFTTLDFASALSDIKRFVTPDYNDARLSKEEFLALADTLCAN